jgi:hypothetical protein
MTLPKNTPKIHTRDISFYRYILSKRNELQDLTSDSDSLDDLLLEMLDFVWYHLTPEEINDINEHPT